MVGCPFVTLEEVFRTAHGAVLQCTHKNCFWLEFSGDCTAFKVADFLRFKESIMAINVQELLEDVSRSSDYTILMPFRSKRCFVLNVVDILHLRALLEGTLFVMELQRTINECLSPKAKVKRCA